MPTFLIIILITLYYIIGRAVMWCLNAYQFENKPREVSILTFLFGEIDKNSNLLFDEINHPFELFFSLFWPLVLLILGIFLLFEKFSEQLDKTGNLINKIFNFLFGWLTKPIFTFGKKEDSNDK